MDSKNLQKILCWNNFDPLPLHLRNIDQGQLPMVWALAESKTEIEHMRPDSVVRVHTLTGKSYDIRYKIGCTLLELKDLIYNVTQVPPSALRLINNGTQLSDYDKITEEMNDLHMVLRLRGGWRLYG
jgi:hypothetical protein